MRAPPLSAIEALMAAVETGNFRKAAEQLALSPSALSRRIQALEAALGEQLFDRSGHAVQLTDAGRRYVDAVEGPMRAIATASGALHGSRQAPLLRVMASHSLATAWLTPRLGELAAEVSDYEVEVVIGRTPSDFRKHGADLAILAGPGDTAELDTRPLVDLVAVPVAAPTLANGEAAPRTLQQIVAARRLAVSEPRGLWEHWARAAGFNGPVAPSARSYETLMMLYEASAAGLGVSLGVALHTDRHLREGRLQRLLDLRVPMERSYLLAVSPWLPSGRRTHMQRLCDWLQMQAEQSAAAFAAH